MNDILLDFQEYLLNTNKKLANNTLIAYRADISEFLNFIFKKNKQIKEIKSKDFFDFFNLLQKKRLSISAGSRKIAALKIFATYLNVRHNLVDYSTYIQKDLRERPLSTLPIICSSKLAFKTIQNYKKAGLNSYNELRNFVMLHLLYVSKISINKLVKIKIEDINYNLFQITLPDAKSLKLSPDFFKIIQEYIKKMPHKSSYLFPTFKDTGCGPTEVKPISKQAVWTILRSIFKKEKYNEINNFHNCKGARPAFEFSTELLNIYKIKHPRA